MHISNACTHCIVYVNSGDNSVEKREAEGVFWLPRERLVQFGWWTGAVSAAVGSRDSFSTTQCRHIAIRRSASARVYWRTRQGMLLTQSRLYLLFLS